MDIHSISCALDSNILGSVLYMYTSSHNNIDSLHIYEGWCRLMHVSIVSCALDACAKYCTCIILTSLQGNFDHMAEVRCGNVARSGHKLELVTGKEVAMYVKPLFSG